MAVELEDEEADKDLEYIVKETLVVVFTAGLLPQVFFCRGFPQQDLLGCNLKSHYWESARTGTSSMCPFVVYVVHYRRKSIAAL